MKHQKRRKLIIVLILTSLSLTSCTSIREITEQEIPSNRISPIRPINVIAENTATPEPQIVIREPVKSHSPMRIQTDVPEGVIIPDYYQAIDLKGVNHVVYAFQNRKNKTLFRVYAEVDNLEDEVVMSTNKGFYNAYIYLSDDNTYKVETNKDDDPIDLSKEKPAKYTPCQAPTKAAIQSYVKASEKAKAAYEKEVNKAEKSNAPIPEPTPWDGLPILTNETEAIVLPKNVKLLNKKNVGLYYYINIYGENVYRQYATPDGTYSAFYLSDENGSIMKGALPIDMTLDFTSENFKTGKAIERNDNIERLPVIINLSDNTEASVYTVYNK